MPGGANEYAKPRGAPLSIRCSWNAAHIVGRGGVGRALQISREPLAAVNMAALRMRVELARNRILDHALTQRADGTIVGHGEFHLLSEVAKTSILKKGLPTPQSFLAQLVNALQFSARLSGLSRSDLVQWHIASVSGLIGMAAIEGQPHHRRPRVGADDHAGRADHARPECADRHSVAPAIGAQHRLVVA